MQFTIGHAVDQYLEIVVIVLLYAHSMKLCAGRESKNETRKPYGAEKTLLLLSHIWRRAVCAHWPGGWTEIGLR